MTENNTPATNKRVEGRVAQILNERELVINIGSEMGVKRGMKFAILAPKPLEIVDPETKVVLDHLDREKVRVAATEVRPKVTVCKTYKTRIVGGIDLRGFSAMREAMTPLHEEVETLRATNSSFPPPLSPEESYVKINDRVVQVLDDD